MSNSLNETKCIICNKIVDPEHICTVVHMNNKYSIHHDCENSIDRDSLDFLIKSIKNYDDTWFFIITKNKLIQLYKEVLKPIGITIKGIQKMRKGIIVSRLLYNIEQMLIAYRDYTDDTHILHTYIDLTNFRDYLQYSIFEDSTIIGII